MAPHLVGHLGEELEGEACSSLPVTETPSLTVAGLSALHPIGAIHAVCGREKIQHVKIGFSMGARTQLFIGKESRVLQQHNMINSQFHGDIHKLLCYCIAT